MAYSEFLEWLEFLEQEKNEHSKLDWYLAQIAQWICKVNSENPKKVEVSDFLLKFSVAEEKEEQTPEQAKQVWAAALGISLPKE